MSVAPYVVAIAALAAVVASVIAAASAWLALNLARKMRSTISLQGELAEIRDYMGKIDAWAKRINARETMQERRAAESEPPRKRSLTPVSTADVKDELRRRAGLVAGQPARHARED